MAWLVGEGIVVYRTVKFQHAPPSPGQLLYTSGIFILLALLAEAEKARPLATTLAWGFDIAAFLNLYPLSKQGKGNAPSWPPPTLPDTVIFPGQTPATGGTDSGQRNLLPGPNVGKPYTIR
jgi:hypothetical protein